MVDRRIDDALDYIDEVLRDYSPAMRTTEYTALSFMGEKELRVAERLRNHMLRVAAILKGEVQ